MIITFDSNCAQMIMDFFDIKGISPCNFAGIIGNKIFTKDLPSIIEMSDELKLQVTK